MKQVLTAKFSFILFLAAFALICSSFLKEKLSSNSGKPDHMNNCVPFKGKFTVSFIPGGVSGGGTGSHIGKFTFVTEDDESAFPVITGTTTITAANGDEISGFHTGLATDLGNGMLGLTFTDRITGGTGRFYGATGTFTEHSIANENTGTATATFDGTICY